MPSPQEWEGCEAEPIYGLILGPLLECPNMRFYPTNKTKCQVVYEKFNSVGPTPPCLFVQSQTHLEGDEPAPTRTMVKTKNP
jgi:hypothetical protein